MFAQQDEVQKKAKDLQKTMSEFQKSLEEGCALMKEKNIKIEMQAKRERELYASVHRYIIGCFQIHLYLVLFSFWLTFG